MDRKVLSAPVVSREGGYEGFLELRDLVSFAVFVHDRHSLTSFGDIIEHGIKMFDEPLQGITVPYLARRHPLVALSEGSTLLDAVEQLALPHVHRVPVLNAQGRIVNIISQSTIMKELEGKHSGLALNDVVALGSGPVRSVSTSASAYEAFKLMDANRISGLAIVDSANKLIGCTTGNDLKLYIQDPHTWKLSLPINDFLNGIRSQQIDVCTPPHF